MILGSYCLGWMTVPHAFSSIGTIGASGHDSLIIAHIARVERRSAASVYSVEMSGASAKPCGVRAWSCLSARGRTDAARATQQLSRTMAGSAYHTQSTLAASISFFHAAMPSSGT